MNPHRAVERDGRLSEDLGQLARGPAPLEVHLEEPVLRMQVTKGARHVGAGGAVDGGHAGRVTVDSDRGGETGQRSRAVQQGQVAAHQPPEAGRDQQRDDQQHAQHAGKQAKTDGGRRHDGLGIFVFRFSMGDRLPDNRAGLLHDENRRAK